MNRRWLLLVAIVGCRRIENAQGEGTAAVALASPPPSSKPAASSAPIVPAKPSASAAKPVSPSETRPLGSILYAVIGDYGSDSADEAQVAALVKSWTPDFVVTTGDNNYPNGEASTIDMNIGKYYAEFIGNYRGRFGPGSTTNRFWPSPGNHDWVSGLTAYTEYFTLPGNERYYDVDLGLVHIYALDSDPHEPDGVTVASAQAKWLKGRLASSKSCYDVVYFHHAPYSSSRHGSSEHMRWPFHAWGAEAVLSGHDHSYERTSVDGIPYFVMGLSGAAKYDFPNPPLPETQFRYNDAYGAMKVVVTQQAATYDFFTADGTKRDSTTVAAPATCSK